jgi:hypothetical protein
VAGLVRSSSSPRGAADADGACQALRSVVVVVEVSSAGSSTDEDVWRAATWGAADLPNKGG